MAPAEEERGCPDRGSCSASVLLTGLTQPHPPPLVIDVQCYRPCQAAIEEVGEKEENVDSHCYILTHHQRDGYFIWKRNWANNRNDWTLTGGQYRGGRDWLRLTVLHSWSVSKECWVAACGQSVHSPLYLQWASLWLTLKLPDSIAVFFGSFWDQWFWCLSQPSLSSWLCWSNLSSQYLHTCYCAHLQLGLHDHMLIVWLLYIDMCLNFKFFS